MVHFKSKLFLVLLAANMASVLAAPAPASSDGGFEIKRSSLNLLADNVASVFSVSVGTPGPQGAEILKSRPPDFDITKYRVGNPTTGKSTKAAEVLLSCHVRTNSVFITIIVEDNAPIIPVRNPNSSQGKMMTFGFDKPEEKRG
ncbi:hypothetical protein C8R42DRAFT_727905 [Lentinula raphanica]|nr:hypothetical protein C8R42DRAFT_727905 [Lentinula raphanica]